jgi:hypothetical protein
MKLLALIIFLSSCSFKPQEKKDAAKEAVKSPHEVAQGDTDGDGTLDIKEVEDGSDPFIADIPTFEGAFFDGMNVRINFYNRKSSLNESLNWIIKNDKIKLSWEEEEKEVLPGSLYMDSLLKSYAASSDFKKNNFKFFDYNEGIYSHSSPILSTPTLLSISSKILSLQKQGFEIERAEAIIRSVFKINSNKYTHFKNPVFDLYYKSLDREGLIFIESKHLDGTYAFNEENEINISFENFDASIINEGLLSGGARFFLKIRDFTIYDTEESFSSILEKVLSVSVPVTISYPESEKSSKSKVETIYIGTGGTPELLKSILQKGLKGSILMSETSIDQVRNLSNRQRSFGESHENETLRWYVGSSEINDNIYSYKFSPNQGIGLSYLSDKRASHTPLFVSRTIVVNDHLASSGLLPSTTKDLKIKIIAQKLITPYEKKVRFVRSDCGRGYWRTNEVTYDQIKLDYKDETHLASELILRDAFINLKSSNGSLLSGNIQRLVNEGLLILNSPSPSTELDIRLSPKLKRELISGRKIDSIEIFLEPKTYPIRKDLITKVKEDCQREKVDQERGGSGGYGGGGNNKIMNLSAGFGVEERETEYELDLHIFSY